MRGQGCGVPLPPAPAPSTRSKRRASAAGRMDTEPPEASRFPASFACRPPGDRAAAARSPMASTMSVATVRPKAASTYFMARARRAVSVSSAGSVLSSMVCRIQSWKAATLA